MMMSFGALVYIDSGGFFIFMKLSFLLLLGEARGWGRGGRVKGKK